MIKDNKEVFDEFQKIHDAYALNEAENQEQFNEKGKAVMNIVRKYEDILCKRSEVHGFGEYTSKLAEKFQNEVRKNFPKIDQVGIKRMVMKPVESAPPISPSFRRINMK